MKAWEAAGIEPGGREPAPDDLALVQAFVNTNDLEDGRELLATPAMLRDWLRARDLLGADEAIGAAEWARAIAAREAIRALALANNGGPADEAAIDTLNRAAGAAPLAAHFDDAGRARVVPAAAGLDAFLGRLLAIIATATIDGTWPRLKACHRDACRWLFYDTSKNHSGQWCTMAICGSRAKARAYRARRRTRA